MSKVSDWTRGHKGTVAAICAVLVVGGAGLGWRAHAAKNAQPAVASEKVFTVRVIQAEAGGSDVSLKYTGLVQPQEMIQCFPETVTTIEELYVKEGDQVQKGQPLARLNMELAGQQAQSTADGLESARLMLASAQRNRDLARADYEKACKPAPADQLAEARGQRDADRTRRDQKQQELDRINELLSGQQQKTDGAKALREEACQKTLDAQQALSQAQAEVQAATQAAQQAREQDAAAELRLEEARQTLEQAQMSGDAQQIAQAQSDWDEAATAREQTAQAAQAAAEAETAAQQQLAAAQQAVAEAQTAQEEASLAYAEEQAELTRQKVKLGHGEAEASLQAAQLQLNTSQGRVDLLESMGPESEAARLQRQRLDGMESAVTQAQILYDSAQRSNDRASSSAAKDRLLAPAAGQVVKLMGTEGGVASPILPVAVLAGQGASVQFGVSQTDVRSLWVGMPAQVKLDGVTYTGSITAIDLLPDETTRTYPVSVAVDTQDELFLGSMAEVELGLGQRTGVWMPLSVILNDGQDYLYIVEDGYALRRDVNIREVSNDKVLVDGVQPGDLVISQGMKTVHSGSAVQIAEQSGGDAA